MGRPESRLTSISCASLLLGAMTTKRTAQHVKDKSGPGRRFSEGGALFS